MNKQVIVSAGDAITAKLVEQEGFDGIWVSGFEVSARMGLADNGSLTMTEMINACRPIVRAVKIPVWVDIDTGYNNFQRTVKEFENIGVAGVCVEDNIPELKTNSLWGGPQKLMQYEDFKNKITVARCSLKIIARTEALVRGYGITDAIIRAAQYSRAADIILIHTRDSSGLEARAIAEGWKNISLDTPLALVPTKFPTMTNQRLFNMGYDMIIWANQTERVKIKAIRDALAVLKKDDCAINIENNLSATLDDMRGLCPLK